MKIGHLVALASLLELSLARPPRHLPRERADAVVTHTVWETVQAPDVIVWVDENGNSASQGLASAPTPAPSLLSDPQVPAAVPAEPLAAGEAAPVAVASLAPAPEASAEEVPASEHAGSEGPASNAPPQEASPPVLYTSEGQEIPAPAPAPADPPVTELPPAPEVNQVDSSNGYTYNERSGYGISWSNYNADQTYSSCKTVEQADQEWARLADYDVVRVYGTDCGQPVVAFELAKKYNKKVFVGIYWLDERLDEQIRAVIDAVESSGVGWSPVDTVSIGNEDVHRREKTPAEVIAIVTSAKNQFRSAGYNGPVVHVDSQDSILANPELCSEEAGDYIAANVHPFFNDHTPAGQAGDFVRDQIELLRQCGANKRRRRDDVRVRVTEVGWPKAGDANGDAVPSKDNQHIAIDSIKSQDLDHLILFSAFDHKWMKDGPTTFNTEKHWGILDG